MKLVFGKGKVSREEIEQQAASEIDALISSSDGPPPIDWSVYGLSADVADPAVASEGLAATTSAGAPDHVDHGDEVDDLNGQSPIPSSPAPERAAPRRRSPTPRAKPASRAAAGSRNTTATKAKSKVKATAKPRARAAKKPIT